MCMSTLGPRCKWPRAQISGCGSAKNKAYEAHIRVVVQPDRRRQSVDVRLSGQVSSWTTVQTYPRSKAVGKYQHHFQMSVSGFSQNRPKRQWCISNCLGRSQLTKPCPLSILGSQFRPLTDNSPGASSPPARRLVGGPAWACARTSCTLSEWPFRPSSTRWCPLGPSSTS